MKTLRTSIVSILIGVLAGCASKVHIGHDRLPPDHLTSTMTSTVEIRKVVPLYRVDPKIQTTTITVDEKGNPVPNALHDVKVHPAGPTVTNIPWETKPVGTTVETH